MPKKPELHPHSDRAAFNRLMLLAAAIAQNPGIAPGNTGGCFREEMIKAMKAIALEQDIAWVKDWSEPTLRKDLETLRNFGLVPSGTALQSGYYLGRKQAN